ncbi:MAG: phosphoribosylglycinamide formyltransferase [Proteobacteria bacterium]|nr:phosphoribosylglycinamide formyltransferase [Pseudomonadota bacterium]MBU1638958.1 phosphoribosylglycinamide formyltransferase [Pseudomonadota bacterium]
MKMGVLLSGSGRTLDNFHDRIAAGTMQGALAVVVSNVQDALGLQKAEKYGYPAFHAQGNEAINKILLDHGVELVLLAGYLKLYVPPVSLAHNVINIHPSLIPAFCGSGFYGMRVHRAVKARGVRVTGCTVHFANEVYDEGPIIVQKCVHVDDDDSPDDIAHHVFDMECEAFPEAINRVHDLGVDYFWQRVAVAKEAH